MDKWNRVKNTVKRYAVREVHTKCVRLHSHTHTYTELRNWLRDKNAVAGSVCVFLLQKLRKWKISHVKNHLWTVVLTAADTNLRSHRLQPHFQAFFLFFSLSISRATSHALFISSGTFHYQYKHFGHTKTYYVIIAPHVLRTLFILCDFQSSFSISGIRMRRIFYFGLAFVALVAVQITLNWFNR